MKHRNRLKDVQRFANPGDQEVFISQIQMEEMATEIAEYLCQRFKRSVGTGVMVRDDGPMIICSVDGLDQSLGMPVALLMSALIYNGIQPTTVFEEAILQKYPEIA